MQESASAFSPGDITCFFKAVADKDPTKMHSLGLSFTVSEGVSATVSPTDNHNTEISFNGSRGNFPTLEMLFDDLNVPNSKVVLTSPLPLSCGFGLSAASCLAASFAANQCYQLGLSERELALASHVAEVRNLTGLGDVCVQFGGGCRARFVPGKPLESVAVAVTEQPIYYRYISPLSTRLVLGSPEKVTAINKAAEKALSNIKDLIGTCSQIDFDEVIRISRRFSAESGLLLDPEVVELIDQIEGRGGCASMIMLGNAVFSTTEFDGAQQVQLTTDKARPISL